MPRSSSARGRGGASASRASSARFTKRSWPSRKFHTFRHTHVSELLSRGESVVHVARRVGDRPEVILKTYAHWIPGSGKRIAGRLEEMYG
jgi:integrase